MLLTGRNFEDCKNRLSRLLLSTRTGLGRILTVLLPAVIRIVFD